MYPVEGSGHETPRVDHDQPDINLVGPPIVPDSVLSQNQPTSNTFTNTSLNITYASRQGIDRTAIQNAELADQYEANQVNTTDSNLDDEKGALLLDLTQMALDIAGIVDPTPISDGVSGVISLFRGDWLGAGISVASMIPYVGDLAKAGKLPKVLKSIERAIELAGKDAKFAERLAPVLEKLRSALHAAPLDKLPSPIRRPLESMRNKIDDFFNSTRKSDNFVGEVRGQRVELPGVRTERFSYTKRDRVQYEQLRKDFDNSGRADFLKRLAREQEDKLRAAGLNDAEIALVKEGKVPQGWQVHHKKPLDDGGDNSFNNLVLIKNDPYHQAITNAQKRLVGDLTPGQTRAVDFPIPEGSIYPPKP
jgi:hypothetical protein